MLTTALWISLIVSIAAVAFAYFEMDRWARTRLLSWSSAVDRYKKSPTSATRRVVATIAVKPGDTLSDVTVRSLMDQSVRPHEIYVEDETVPEKYKSVVTVVPRGTLRMRERDASTVVLSSENGRAWPYDAVESI